MNEETGLPELPDDHFWRVTTDIDRYNRPILVLQLRRKRFIGSALVLEDTLGRTNEKFNDASIKFKAEYILAKWEEHKARWENHNYYLGDYPPKSLR